MGLIPALPNHLQVACGLIYFQSKPLYFPFLCWQLWQWKWASLCLCMRFLLRSSLWTPCTSPPNCSLSLCSCSELPPKEQQQMHKMTQFLMVLQLSVALWIAAVKLTVVPGLVSPCSENFWAGAEVLCCLSESAPCLYLPLQLLHSGDCGVFSWER